MNAEPFRPPAHFRAEQRQLEQGGVDSWQALAALTDADLLQLAASGAASEARLRRLRGQARLIEQVGITAHEAALLLYAGIPSREALAEALPEQLLRQLGRFQRQLLGRQAPPLDLATVRGWIGKARGGSGRSPN